MTAAGSHSFFATCPRGLESVLARELAALGAREVASSEGGARFAGAFPLCYAANLESRVASRVLWRVGASPYRNEDEVYAAARALPWPRWFSPEHTIRVALTAIRSPLRSLDFTTLRIKDAVCDRFRAECGRRPSVDTRAPDIRIHAFLDAREVMLYLDTSGEALFKRGYRRQAGEAPLRENLAAGILSLAGWAPGTPLLDPMCGSGTIVIEAALTALDIAPGLARAFAFEKLSHFDAAVWRELKRRAQARRKAVRPLSIWGSDTSRAALDDARVNLASLGIERAVTLVHANALDLSPPAPAGTIITNPPYGVRLDQQQKLAVFYPRLGDALKRNFAGWTAYVLSADAQLPKLIGLKASRRTPLYNGALECRLYEYRLVAGSMRRVKAARREE
ncbi:MAG: class I SAM-dependent RNA methyltransferase [Betaproteobacteria bacterium]|nr:class I SAM-dependent RNA methyltransferase [Betaproteobacteria bacterium]